MSCLQRSSRRRGVALIAVLWVVVLAALLLAGLQRSVRADLAIAHGEVEAVRARWLARAGVETAIATLEDDDTGVDSATESWFEDEQAFGDVELIGGMFSVIAPPAPWGNSKRPRFGLTDLGSRLDVNVADKDQLAKALDVDPSVIAAILDWRDKDDETQAGGAEHLYYSRLPFPYRIRNGSFATLGELRLVRGVDPATYFGEDANEDGVLNENEDDQEATAPVDDGDGQLQAGIAGLLTIASYEPNHTASGAKRTNLDSADADTLKKDLNFSDGLAQAVVSAKSKQSGNSSDRGGGRKRFASLMDLLDVKPANKGGSQSNDDSKVNEVTVKWLAEHWDELTLSGETKLSGRLNVNTASRQALGSLPEMTDSAVEAILRRQAGGGSGPFESVGELLTDGALTEAQFKAVAEKLSVRSGVFEIRSVGVTKFGVRSDVTVIVDRDDPMTVLYWRENE